MGCGSARSTSARRAVAPSPSRQRAGVRGDLWIDPKRLGRPAPPANLRCAQDDRLVSLRATGEESHGLRIESKRLHTPAPHAILRCAQDDRQVSCRAVGEPSVAPEPSAASGDFLAYEIPRRAPDEVPLNHANDARSHSECPPAPAPPPVPARWPSSRWATRPPFCPAPARRIPDRRSSAPPGRPCDRRAVQAQRQDRGRPEPAAESR